MPGVGAAIHLGRLCPLVNLGWRVGLLEVGIIGLAAQVVDGLPRHELINEDRAASAPHAGY